MYVSVVHMLHTFDVTMQVRALCHAYCIVCLIVILLAFYSSAILLLMETDICMDYVLAQGPQVPEIA